jgi:hypothetical protein
VLKKFVFIKICNTLALCILNIVSAKLYKFRFSFIFACLRKKASYFALYVINNIKARIIIIIKRRKERETEKKKVIICIYLSAPLPPPLLIK